MIIIIIIKIAWQAWSRPDPSLSSALWRLQKRPTQSSRRCRSKTGKPQNRPLGCPRLWRGGGHLVGLGEEHLVETQLRQKQKMALPRSDWGQQVCFQLDKQTNRQVANGQVVRIYHLTIFPSDQDQPCVFNWSKHKKSNSCWSQHPKFRFEDLASGPSFEIWTKNFQKM